MTEEKGVEFAIPAKNISGEIRVVGGEILANWYEWEGDDSHRVLQAMGEALGFPVMYVEGELHCVGNGHYSAKLRRATSEEAAIQAKIAACPTLDYWRLPPYKRLDTMQVELGNALIHVYSDDEVSAEPGQQWVVDASKVTRRTFFGKWAEQIREDCLEAARTGSWPDARHAAAINFSYAPRGPEDAERVALLILADARNQPPEKQSVFSEGMILTMGRSHGLVYVRALQEQLERFRKLFGFVGDLPEMFNVKGVVRRYLRENPGRRSRYLDPRLVEIADGE